MQFFFISLLKIKETNAHALNNISFNNKKNKKQDKKEKFQKNKKCKPQTSVLNYFKRIKTHRLLKCCIG